MKTFREKSTKLRVCKAIPFALVFTLISPSALGDAVTWYLLNVKTDDGAAVTGSFVFDADINAYVSINIVAAAGSVLSTQSYGEPNPTSPGNSEVLIAVPDASVSPLDGERVIALNFLDSLTNDGGTVALDLDGFSFEGICLNNCGQASPEPSRRFIEGLVTSYPPPPAVPVPTLPLFGLGALVSLLGFFGLCKLRQ